MKEKIITWIMISSISRKEQFIWIFILMILSFGIGYFTKGIIDNIYFSPFI